MSTTKLNTQHLRNNLPIIESSFALRTMADEQGSQELGAFRFFVNAFFRASIDAFPGMRGSSAQNLWKMRDLHDSYGHMEKLQPLVAEINWYYFMQNQRQNNGRICIT